MSDRNSKVSGRNSTVSNRPKFKDFRNSQTKIGFRKRFHIPSTRKGAGGTGSRVPHARKGAGPGHSRVPVRARTHHGDVPPTGWIDSVVQIQASIVFLGTHGVELLLHLAEHGLMKLVPIYMF